MRLLPFRIGLGHLGPRSAQPETQLAEQTLTLPHPQLDPIFLLDPRRQRLAVPQIPAQTQLTRHPVQRRVDFLELLFTEAPRTAGSLSLAQAGQTFLFKTAYPILDRSWCVAQQSRHFRTGHPLRDQQYAVQAMVIPRFLRSSDLILQSQHNGGGIRNAKWSHSSMRSQLLTMRNYL